MRKNKIQTILTPSGDCMAVIPLAEYKRLVEAHEDVEDARTVENSLAKLKAGHMRTFSLEEATAFADRLRTENPIRVLREMEGMTQAKLAEKIGVTKMYISQIECGHRMAGRQAMVRIAEVLKTDIDTLMRHQMPSRKTA